MSQPLEHPEPVLSLVNNELARRRILDNILNGHCMIPRASYDYQKMEYCIIEGILRVTFFYNLPKTRQIKRQSLILGGDLALIVTVWPIAPAVPTRMAVVNNRVTVDNDVSTYEIHIIVPLREDLSAIDW